MEARAEEILASTILVILSTVLFWICLSRRKERASAFSLVSPSAVFLVGVLARFALGGLIVSLTPRSLVLGGEYRQYLVTWTYSGEVAYLWIGYIIVGAFSFAFLEWLKTRVLDKKKSTHSRNKQGWFQWMKDIRSRGSYSSGELKMVTAGCVSVFFIGACISAMTGSMDRGSSYQYFASLPFRPEAAFIAFTRLRQVGYFLVPLVWKECSRGLRLVLAMCASFPLILEIIAGGRGSVLYPLVMMFLGYVCISRKQSRVVICGALLLVVVGLAVPYMAAYRDSTAMQSRSHNDVIGRVTSLVQGVDKERIGYRYMALGREIYACSDGFVVEAAVDKKMKMKNAGFSDIDIALITKVVLPRWIAEDKSFEKGDGANIAKSLMGVSNSTWFPCITTPADLFRRGGWNGVVVGGVMMGFVIWCLEALWMRAGEGARSLELLVITVLPASYIQSGLFGTVREVMWQLLWDLPKYILALVVLGRLASWIKAVHNTSEE